MARLSNELRRNIERQIFTNRAVQQNVRRIITKEFENIKAEMIALFDAHLVTLEIEADIFSENISGTLNGVGNLYGYIGFRTGSRPVEVLRKALEASILKFNFSALGKPSVTIQIPTKEELFAVTPMPWANGRSWAKGIETGIAGFGRFLSEAGHGLGSRSGGGIQTENNVRSGRFRNTSYLSTILKTYEKEIKKLPRRIKTG